MKDKLYPGDFLIADPSIMGDLNFHRAVILICTIEDKAPMGFIFNKIFDVNLKDLVPEIDCDFPLFYGGPVEEDQLFFVYQSTAAIVDNSRKIAPQLFLGGDSTQAFEALEDRRLHSQNCRFFLGYSGWAKGQLEQEINLNSWLIQKNSKKELPFTIKAGDLWRNAMIHKGGKYTLWANAPDNPTYN